MQKQSDMHDLIMQTRHHQKMAKDLLALTCILGTTGAAALLISFAMLSTTKEPNEVLHITSIVISAIGGSTIGTATKAYQLYRKEKQNFEQLNAKLKELQK